MQHLLQQAPPTSRLTSTFANERQDSVNIQTHPNTTTTAAANFKCGGGIDSAYYSTHHHHNQQLLPATSGVNQIEMMNKLHEFDKQNAVLRAQLDFALQVKDSTAAIQQATKDLCFEILDKGADLTKQGATVSAENNTALSTTISNVFAVTRFRKEEDSSSATSTVSSPNGILLPVIAAANQPTVVNLSATTDESTSLSRVTISQQQNKNPQPLPHTPHPAVPPFYPTIQGTSSVFRFK